MEGISWPSSIKNSPKPPTGSSNLSLKLGVRSGSVTPTQSQCTTQKGNDSFSNLVSFGRDKRPSNLSLSEQQKQREEQRRKDEAERQQKLDGLFGGGGSGWDALDKIGSSASCSTVHNADDGNDILASFNSSAPVDRSSHYPPPPKSTTSDHSNGAIRSGVDDLLGIPSSFVETKSSLDVFDPFDIENLPSRGPSPLGAAALPTAETQAGDDFDILGDLAKPVNEIAHQWKPYLTPSPGAAQHPETPVPASDPRDLAIADIMEMGFTAEQTKKALAETDTGLDVQTAVSWLLEDAHRKSRLESSNPNQSKHDGDSSLSQQIRERDDTIPVWAKSGKSGAGEKDIGAIAAEVGGNIFKSANNLWNTSMKKVEKAVSDLRVDLSADNISGPPQPKWMRERQIREELEKRGARGISRQDRPPRNTLDQELDSGKNNALITEEALMLETNCGPPKSRRKNKEDTPIAIPAFVRNSQPAGLSEHEQIIHRRQQRLESAIWDKERDVRERERVEMDPVIPDNSSRKAKMALSDEPVYVSRNRRRLPKSAPLATSPRRQTPEPDLLGVGGGYTNHSTTTTGSSLNPFDCNIERTKSPTSSVTPAAPPARCHRVPQRPHIPVSPSALSQSNAARQKGTEAFKRGDYTAAQAAYTSALIPLPDQHTLRIVILANRSLCTLKLGDPKSALADLDEILTHIGDSHGECETILLDNTEREMTEYWTKAITRKAEALEQLEKWTDAKAVWELALLSPGSSGSTSLAINGKRRCESALKPKPKAPPRKAPTVVTRTKITTTGGDATAVKALRQANAEQARRDTERLALHDVVHDKIGLWKNGKEGNLRALLAGLDTVLWEGCGWKKVGMAELVMPQKCKFVYMKGIAKVHPDKIPSTATTEQRMISAAVFSLLNESWDKFKAENGL